MSLFVNAILNLFDVDAILLIHVINRQRAWGATDGLEGRIVGELAIVSLALVDGSDVWRKETSRPMDDGCGARSRSRMRFVVGEEWRVCCRVRWLVGGEQLVGRQGRAARVRRGGSRGASFRIRIGRVALMILRVR